MKDKKILAYVAYLVSLSERSRKEGLLSLEKELDLLSFSTLKSGLSLIVDGADIEYVNIVCKNTHKQMESKINILKSSLDIEFLKMLNEGASPYLVERVLLSHFNEKFQNVYNKEKEAKEKKIDENIIARFKDLSTNLLRRCVYAAPRIEKIFEKMKEEEINRFFNYILLSENHSMISIILSFNSDLRCKVYDSLSDHVKRSLVEYLENQDKFKKTIEENLIKFDKIYKEYSRDEATKSYKKYVEKALLEKS